MDCPRRQQPTSATNESASGWLLDRPIISHGADLHSSKYRNACCEPTGKAMRRIATAIWRTLLSLGLVILIERIEPSGNALHATAFRFIGIHRHGFFGHNTKQLTFPFINSPRKAFQTCIYLSSNDAAPDEFAEARDGEAVQTLFSKYCDNDGLMTKTTLQQIPAVSELLVSSPTVGNQAPLPRKNPLKL